MTDFKELREALDAYEKWLADGAPVVDPDDTYPDDLYLAATRPAPIRSLLDRLEAASGTSEQQAGEAVAFVTDIAEGKVLMMPRASLVSGLVPLFTRPLQPLTREQVKALMAECGYDHASPQERADFINGIRHAEKALGITKDTK